MKYGIKYGIFESKVGLSKLPERLFDIVCQDTGIGNPIKIYDSKTEALTELKKISFGHNERKLCKIKFYDCIVNFVAECEKIDEDEGEIIENLKYCLGRFCKVF